jgi:hypothetical protein
MRVIIKKAVTQTLSSYKIKSVKYTTDIKWQGV